MKSSLVKKQMIVTVTIRLLDVIGWLLFWFFNAFMAIFLSNVFFYIFIQWMMHDYYSM
jgi:hypothetical protein